VGDHGSRRHLEIVAPRIHSLRRHVVDEPRLNFEHDLLDREGEKKASVVAAFAFL